MSLAVAAFEPDNLAMRQTLLAGWIAFVYLLVGSSGAHFWLDSGELAAAGHELGVTHPPGAPGYVLLLRMSALIGMGSLGFRMAVLGAILGAVTVAGVVEILRGRGATPWVSFGAAAWLLAGWTFVRQTRVVEIYALEGALLVLVLWGFDPAVPDAQRTRRRLLGVFAAVWAAWCFGDLRLALVVPVVVGWGVALRRGRAWARWAPVVVTFASAVVLAVVLAAARDPISNWGAPATLGPWWDHVTAASIRAAFPNEILPAAPAMWMHNAAVFMQGMTEDLGPVGIPVVALALVGLWLRDAEGHRQWLVALGLSWIVLVLVVYAVGINPMGIEDRQTGLPLAVVAVVVVGEVARRWLLGMGRAVWAVAPLLWTVLVLPAGLTSMVDATATRSWAPHRWTAAALDQLPPGSLILTQSDDLAAGLSAARELEGARPDVGAVVSQHLHKPTSERRAQSDPVRRAHDAARGQDTEAARIEAVIATHQAPVALEFAGAAIHADVRFWSEWGRVPLRIGKVNDAMKPTLERAADPNLEVDQWLGELPAEPDRRRLATALSNDARAVLRIERNIRRAIETLVAVVERVTPRHPSSLVALGALREQLGDHEAAIALTRRALELEPDRQAALTNLALYLSRDAATLAEARASAQRATELRPWHPTGWVRLAAIAEIEGDVDAARAARQRLDALSPDGLGVR